ncbi:sulfotransferase family protein [Amycolatopsis antarctica]|uniref:Sulfotransferase family protein n=1 Tax=Amycolatopsis antarctica TaxID=1854586 RepID=A0A263CZ15_9PSEU|nr:sulfotransferase family protein [Amycolatopsis antarctica]
MIGAGFGRTGTVSVREALSRLGFGPCYHFSELIGNPAHLEHWTAALDGAPAAADRALAEYQSTLDWPGASLWRELADRHPDAKVLLTVRDPRSWYRSFASALLPMWQAATAEDPRLGIPELAPFLPLIARISGRQFGEGDLADAEYMTGVFTRHIEDVRAAIAPERLLVFDVAQGWEPLCEFLGVAVPDGEPFPHLNDSRSFRDAVDAHREP